MSYLKRHGTRDVPSRSRCRARAGPRAPGAAPRRSTTGPGCAGSSSSAPSAGSYDASRDGADPRERAGGRAVHRADGLAGRRRGRRASASGPGAAGTTRPSSALALRRRASATPTPGGPRLEALPRVRPDRHAPAPVRGVRRGLPRLGPFAAARGRALVRGATGRGARLPGASRTARRDGVAHRDLLRLRPPGADGVRRATATRREPRPRAALRLDRPRRHAPTACRAWSRGSCGPRRPRRRPRRRGSSREYRLPREAVRPRPPSAPAVWAALLRRHADGGAWCGTSRR